MRVFGRCHARLPASGDIIWTAERVRTDVLGMPFLPKAHPLGSGASHSKRGLGVSLMHPIWRAAVVKVETVFIGASDRHGFNELRFALDCVQRRANTDLESAQLTRSIHEGEISTFLPGHQFRVATTM